MVLAMAVIILTITTGAGPPSRSERIDGANCREDTDLPASTLEFVLKMAAMAARTWASGGRPMSDMKRREFMILLGAAAACPLAAGAQQPDRVRRVGVLMGIADDPEGQARVMVFRQALQALGWTEGRNVQFIYRWSAGDVVHARQFAKELFDLRSDVILTNSTPLTVAVRDTTRTTPTVFVQVSDPVTAGVVQSLARPGGNLTGFTNFEPSIASKWLELVKGVAPNIRRIAYLFNPNTAPLFYARSVETAAPLLSVKPFAAAVHNAAEMERVIEQFFGELARMRYVAATPAVDELDIAAL